MKYPPVALLLFVSLSTLLFGFQAPVQIPSGPDKEVGDTRLPNGKSQRDEMLKADHAKNQEDARELARLSDEVRTELEKNTQYVLSIATMKKVEEIEKLAHRIRTRLKRL